MRVLITSSRTWTDQHAVNGYLFALAQHNNWELTIVHGDAPKGGDRFARQFCDVFHEIYSGIVGEPHAAKWTEPGGIKNPRAGLDRNGLMVALGADECGVFMMPCREPKCRQLKPHGTHGTTNCMQLAHEAGIVIRRFGFGADDAAA
jgi:hypothetical protein